MFNFAKYLTIIIACSYAQISHSDTWVKADKQREVLCLTLIAVDVAQARNASHHYDKYHESNPLLGNAPSANKLRNVGAATAIAHVLIADALPSNYRKVFQYVTIGIESAVVARNYQIGIRVGF